MSSQPRSLAGQRRVDESGEDKARRLVAPADFAAALTAAAGALLLAFLRLRTSLTTGFGPIDDHEQVGWISGRPRLLLTEYLSTLLNGTEVGDIGQYPRFRPTYYAVRVAEAAVFGSNSGLWYWASLVAYGVTVTLLSVSMWLCIRPSVSRLTPPWGIVAAVAVSTLGVLAYGSLNAWLGVTARLGPSELLAMLGVSLVLLAGTQLVGRWSWWWWLPATLGVLLAVRSKENFLPVGLAVVVVGLYSYWRNRRIVDLGFVVLNGALTMTVATIVAVGTGVASAGSDIYGASVGGSRLTSAIRAFLIVFPRYWVPALVVLAAAVLVLSLVRPVPATIDRSLIWVLSVLGCSWLVFDGWVYQGLYASARYWMVFDFLEVCALFAACSLALSVFSRPLGGPQRTVVSIVAAASIGLAALQVSYAPASTRAMVSEAQANDAAVAKWNAGIDQVIRGLDGSGINQVIVVPSDGLDFEPAFAASEFLRVARPDTTVFVLAPEPPNSLNERPQRTIDVLMQQGWAATGLQPLSQWNQSEGTLCLLLNGASPVNQCSRENSVAAEARVMK